MQQVVMYIELYVVWIIGYMHFYTLFMYVSTQYRDIYLHKIDIECIFTYINKGTLDIECMYNNTHYAEFMGVYIYNICCRNAYNI